MQETGEQLFLLFDFQCPLCRRFSEWVECLDKKGSIGVLPLGDAYISKRFPQLDLAAARREFTVCDRLGRAYRGVEALRQIARLLPGIRRLKWMYQLPGVRPALSQVYRAVRRHRKRLCLQCGEKWMPSRKFSRRK